MPFLLVSKTSIDSVQFCLQNYTGVHVPREDLSRSSLRRGEGDEGGDRKPKTGVGSMVTLALTPLQPAALHPLSLSASFYSFMPLLQLLLVLLLVLLLTLLLQFCHVYVLISRWYGSHLFLFSPTWRAWLLSWIFF